MQNITIGTPQFSVGSFSTWSTTSRSTFALLFSSFKPSFSSAAETVAPPSGSVASVPEEPPPGRLGMSIPWALRLD